MLETPHVIVAAAIASKVQNPILALSLAFASHLVTEQIPHWNPHINAEKKKYGHVTKKSIIFIFADSVIAFVAGILISIYALPDLNKAILVFFACFMGVLPDLIEAPYYFFNIKNNFILKKWIPFKKSIQADTGPFWGLLNQVMVIIAALVWIIS